MTRNARQPNATADPELRARVQAAIEAGGFNSEAELAEALTSTTTPRQVAELGSLTTALTVEDVGYALYMKLYQQSDKAKFFKKLMDDQKGMLIVYLTHVGFSPPAIAANLDVSEAYVHQCWSLYADKLGQQVMGIRLQTLVGDLKAKADQLYEVAMRDGKTQLAWKITTDFVGQLQELNIVERAVHRQEVTHKVELDEADLLELDELMSLRRKKQEAEHRLQVTVAAATEADAYPEVMP